jgi:beta-N-acetylhexosaminidase
MSENLMKAVENLPMEIKIGQLIFAGLNSTYVDRDFDELLAECRVGNFCLHDHNIITPGQVGALCAEIVSRSAEVCGGLEPLIAIDEEGGISSRFESGVINLPGNFAIGAADDEGLSFECGRIIGNELSDMGINLVFAPVLDLCHAKTHTIVGVRSFGPDPSAVARLGCAYIRGLNAGGVCATAKHFPGLGNVAPLDGVYPMVNFADLETLKAADVVPFAEAIKAGVDAVMLSHAALPGVFGMESIAFSHSAVTDFLMGTLGFGGVKITTLTTLLADKEPLTPKRVTSALFNAGIDMIVVDGAKRNVIPVYKFLLSMAVKGRVKEERVNASVARVLELKRRAAVYKADRQTVTQLLKHRLISSLCEESVSLLRDPRGLLPLPKDKRVLVIEPVLQIITFTDGTGQMECNLGSFIAAAGYDTDVLRASLTLSADERERIIASAARYDAMIIGSVDSEYFTPYQELIRGLAAVRPVIVVCLRTPYEANGFDFDAAVVGAYSVLDRSMDVAARIISGERRD